MEKPNQKPLVDPTRRGRSYSPKATATLTGKNLRDWVRWTAFIHHWIISLRMFILVILDSCNPRSETNNLMSISHSLLERRRFCRKLSAFRKAIMLTRQRWSNVYVAILSYCEWARHAIRLWIKCDTFPIFLIYRKSCRSSRGINGWGWDRFFQKRIVEFRIGHFQKLSLKTRLFTPV